MRRYKEVQDESSIEEVTDLLEELQLEIDKATFMKARMNRLYGNKEYQSVKAAFHKFDADSSGVMDTKEFNLLAVELGTDPPLRKDELDEGLLQVKKAYTQGN
jgi:Ca2+-binding EF-hand superfamily protein